MIWLLRGVLLGWRLSHTLAARLLAADAKNHRIEPGKDVFKETIVGRQIERLAMEPVGCTLCLQRCWKIMEGAGSDHLQHY